MTWYQQINPIQPPFDAGLAPKGFVERTFNIAIVKVDSDTLEEELVKILVDASVGTFNVDIFAGSKVALPDGEGPYLSLINYGGTAPQRTQNDWESPNTGVPAYEKPTVQVVVRGKSFSTVRTMTRAAYKAFAVVRNTDVVP